MINSVKRAVAFRITVSKDEQVEYRRIVAARKQLKKDEAELIKTVGRHPDIRPAILLSGYSDQPTIEPSQNDSWTVRLAITETVERTAAAATHTDYKAPIHLDPTTVNLLLSGQILTDAEKRDLIKRLAPGFLVSPNVEVAA